VQDHLCGNGATSIIPVLTFLPPSNLVLGNNGRLTRDTESETLSVSHLRKESLGYIS